MPDDCLRLAVLWPVASSSGPLDPLSPLERAASLQGDQAELAQAFQRMRAREMLFFSHEWRPIPEHWTGFPADRHWSKFSQQSDDENQDLKDRWEASRFDWVYLLARCRAAGITEAQDLFWELLEDWAKLNPEHQGYAWLCAQESSIRAFALMFAWGVFGVEDRARQRLLARLVAATAERVSASISYALAQNNNHGLSEAALLFLAGAALPSHPKSRAWKAKGKELLELLGREQFAEDGGYIQHSLNYQRYATRLLAMTVAAARSTGEGLPEIVLQKLEKSADFLHVHLDESTGRAPNYGPNDGSNVFKLDGTGYSDYRGTIAMARRVLGLPSLLPSGPWQESAAWIAETEESPASGLLRSRCLRESGHLVLRHETGFAFMRCVNYQSRPGHADSLHVDIWEDGRCIARDKGTYRYFDRDGWGEYFKSTAGHNTVEIESKSQMISVGPFLFIDWLKGKILSFQEDEMSGEHDGYSRRYGVMHRRTVRRIDGGWLIEDRLINSSDVPRRAVLRWHLDGEQDWKADENGAQSALWSVAVSGSAPIVPDFYSPGSGDVTTKESLYYAKLDNVAALVAHSTVSRRSELVLTTTFSRLYPDGAAARLKTPLGMLGEAEPVQAR